MATVGWGRQRQQYAHTLGIPIYSMSMDFLEQFYKIDKNKIPASA
eukprot:COSAG05_NODE_26537_length_187_cov_18.000000_1_plen_44_part_01